MTENKKLIDNSFINFDNKYINPKNILILLGIIVFLKMLVLNFLTPVFSDDYAYATSTSVLDALQREYARYMEYNGKSITGFFMRLFLILPNSIFSIFNALIYAGLSILIYKIANPVRTYNLYLYLFIIYETLTILHFKYDLVTLQLPLLIPPVYLVL